MAFNGCLSLQSQVRRCKAGFSDGAKTQPVPGHQWNTTSGQRRILFIFLIDIHCDVDLHVAAEENTQTAGSSATEALLWISCFFLRLQKNARFYMMLSFNVLRTTLHKSLYSWKALSHRLCSCHLSISLCNKTGGEDKGLEDKVAGWLGPCWQVVIGVIYQLWKGLRVHQTNDGGARCWGWGTAHKIMHILYILININHILTNSVTHAKYATVFLNTEHMYSICIEHLYSEFSDETELLYF